MTMQLKGCPQCGQPAMLTQSTCARCGHQFQTQYPSGAHLPAPATGPAGTRHPGQMPDYAVRGPVDRTERAVSMVWTGLWGAIVGCFLLFSIGVLVRAARPSQWDGRSDELDLLWALFSGFWVLVWASLFSFLLMRFRRHLLAAPEGAGPSEIATRRSLFAVLASLLVAVILGFGILFGLYDGPHAQTSTPQPVTDTAPLTPQPIRPLQPAPMVPAAPFPNGEIPLPSGTPPIPRPPDWQQPDSGSGLRWEPEPPTTGGLEGLGGFGSGMPQAVPGPSTPSGGFSPPGGL